MKTFSFSANGQPINPDGEVISTGFMAGHGTLQMRSDGSALAVWNELLRSMMKRLKRLHMSILFTQVRFQRPYLPSCSTATYRSHHPRSECHRTVNEVLVTFSAAISAWDTTPPAASNFTVQRRALGETANSLITIDSVQRVSQTQFLIKLTFGANDRRDGQYSVTVTPTGGLATLDQNRNGSLDASQTVTDSKFGFYVTAPVTLDPNVTTVSTTMTYDGLIASCRLPIQTD